MVGKISPYNRPGLNPGNLLPYFSVLKLFFIVEVGLYLKMDVMLLFTWNTSVAYFFNFCCTV